MTQQAHPDVTHKHQPSPIGILFVCLGNICRSPLAQGIFEKKIEEMKLSEIFFADSAGTSSWHHGEKPHHSSIEIAGKYGVDLTKQKSRPVETGDKERFDYFIAMDENNKHSLLYEFKFPVNRVMKIRHFESSDMTAVKPGRDADVPDPYGQGISSFDHVYQMLERCMKPFVEFLLPK